MKKKQDRKLVNQIFQRPPKVVRYADVLLSEFYYISGKDKEKEQICQERDYWRYQEEYERRRIQEENEYHWNCPFFQHC